MNLKLLLLAVLAGAALGPGSFAGDDAGPGAAAVADTGAMVAPGPGAFTDAWGKRVARVVRTGTPKIDGIFDSEWLKAEPAAGFVQRRPVEGAAETAPTRVYLLYDHSALHVCFVCSDPAPDSVSARVLRRDNMDNCDVVGIYLDSFHDHRNAYYFAVTAAGGQIDGTITNETDQNTAWDGIWQSAVGLTDSGWVAEFRIPFSSFRHGGARSDGWGFNLVRSINRRNEGLFWQPVSNQRGLRVNEFGDLVGLEDIGSSRHLEVLPHAVARFDAPRDSGWTSRSEWEDIGFYAKYVPASSWAADFAYQPDFAQVDVDDEVINLSDYPVFITEKRPFFLEVNEFFDTAPIQLLYTRRITDPDFGGRVYSVSDKFRGMVLAGQNRTWDGRGQAVGGGRAQWNLRGQNSVGITATSLYQDGPVRRSLTFPYLISFLGRSYYAHSASVDARVRWGTENRWSVSAAGVARPELTADDETGAAGNIRYDAQPFELRNSIYLDLQAVRMKAQLGNAYRGQDYNINDLGWGDFSNTIEHSLWLGNRWQAPERGFYTYGVDINGWQRSLPDGRFGEGGGQLNLWGITNGNYQIGGGTDWGIRNRRRYTLSPYAGEFRDNFFDYEVGVGGGGALWLGRFDMETYPYRSQWAWIVSDTRRWLSAGTEASYGDFRDGQRLIWNARTDVLLRSNLETRLAGEFVRVWDVADIGRGERTDYRLWRWRTSYSPTLNVTLRATLQWIEAGHWLFTEHPSNTLVSNLMLAWNWRPGSWFYVVYDEGRETPVRYDTEKDRTVRLKGTYFFAVG